MKPALFVMRLSLAGLIVFATSFSTNAQNQKWLHGATGFTRAVELQRQSRTAMVVYFYTDWCPYCRALDDQYLNAASVQRILQRTVAVRINPEDGPAERRIADRYGVTGYPTFLIMQNESARPRNVHPFRKGGNNLTPDQFAKACEDIITVLPTSARVNRTVDSSNAMETASNTAVMNTMRQTRGVQIVEVPRTATAPPKVSSNPLPAIDVILNKYVTAIGGKAAQEKFKSRVIKGRVELSEAGWAQTTVYTKAPNKSLVVLQVDPMGQLRRGFNGQSSWDVGDAIGSRSITTAALSRFSTEVDFYREIKLTELYPGIRLMGTVKDKDREFYLVEGFPRFGDAETMYFETRSGLLTGRDLTQDTPQGPVRIEMRYSDWREVDGVKMPFKITQSMPNFKFVLTVTEVKHNQPLDDKLFEKP